MKALYYTRVTNFKLQMIILQWQPKWKLISFEIIFKKKKYYFLMDLKYKNYIHNLWFWYILIIGSISFRIHSIIEKKGAQRVKGWRMCPFTIEECTVKLTPRTSTIVYLRTVIGVIHNNSQEAGRYSCFTESGARLPKIKS